MALENQELEELAELVEEQSDVIKELAVTQNALLSLLLEKRAISNEELEIARNAVLKTLEES